MNMYLIETDTTQTAGDIIVSDVLGCGIHGSQTGRLGLEYVVPADKARLVALALRGRGYRTITTKRRVSA